MKPLDGETIEASDRRRQRERRDQAKLADKEASTTAGTFPCARCKVPTAMTNYAWGICMAANSVLHSKGMAVIGADEYVLCAECYRSHRDDQDAHIWNQRNADEQLWKQFKEGGINEAALKSQINDKAFYIGYMLPGWNATQRRGSGSGRSKVYAP